MNKEKIVDIITNGTSLDIVNLYYEITGDKSEDGYSYLKDFVEATIVKKERLDVIEAFRYKGIIRKYERSTYAVMLEEALSQNKLNVFDYLWDILELQEINYYNRHIMNIAILSLDMNRLLFLLDKGFFISDSNLTHVVSKLIYLIDSDQKELVDGATEMIKFVIKNMQIHDCAYIERFAEAIVKEKDLTKAIELYNTNPINVQNSTFIEALIKSDRLDIIKELLDRKHLIRYDDGRMKTTFVEMAILHNKLDIFKYIMEMVRGVDEVYMLRLLKPIIMSHDIDKLQFVLNNGLRITEHELKFIIPILIKSIELKNKTGKCFKKDMEMIEFVFENAVQSCSYLRVEERYNIDTIIRVFKSYINDNIKRVE